MLNTLRLSSFRCYPTLNWEIPAEGAILLGDNAQGKTSLLEAVCFALTLHTPRAARLDRLAQHGAEQFGISLDSTEGTRRVRWQCRKLELSINGARKQDYADYLRDAPPVTWLGNSDIGLINGPAEKRRDYLDFLGMQWHPAYRDSLRAYRRALKSRNALLRHPRRSLAALRSYAELLCLHGNCLMALRARLLDLLLPHIRENHQRIAGHREYVAIEYTPSARLPLDQALEESLAADEKAGCTTVGPHRDDFLLTIQGANAADFASEGQQRTLATAMQLAQASLLQVETGHAPVLLIDDIFGELDPARRQALLNMLPEDSQIFITTTHLDWLGSEAPPLPVIPIREAALGS